MISRDSPHMIDDEDKSNEYPDLEPRKPSPEMLDDLGIDISLHSVSDETLQRFCREADIVYTPDRETTIEKLRAAAKNRLSEKSYQPYKNAQDQNEHLKNKPYVNHFTPVNKPKSSAPIEDLEDKPRDALPPLGSVQGPPQFIDWTASKMSAAAIRRECAVREPEISIPVRLKAKEVKEKYGPMLMELDKNVRDRIPRFGRQRSLSPKEQNVETQRQKETYHVRDYVTTPCSADETADKERAGAEAEAESEAESEHPKSGSPQDIDIVDL